MFERLKILLTPDHDNQVMPYTDDQILEFLRTENKAIVNELYTLVLGLYYGEGDRTKSIDGKASAMFGFVGAFVSAIFVVLGIASNPQNAKFNSILSGCAMCCLILILFLLLLALVALFLAVVVKKDWKAPGEKDLFLAIHEYDDHVDGDPTNCDKPSHNYKRHLIEHFWKLYKTSFRQNEAKAVALYVSQLLVFSSLFLLVGVQMYVMVGFRR